MKVSIFGATGYIGLSLLDLLIQHPKVQLYQAMSDTQAGTTVVNGHGTQLDPAFKYTPVNQADIAGADIIFTATPNGFASTIAAQCLKHDTLLLDMAADFRLSESSWAQWYAAGTDTHPALPALNQAVYGLVEWNRPQLKNARIIAVPGCYPTSALLPLIPIAKHAKEFGKDNINIICDSKSGVSGAGRTPQAKTQAGAIMENFSIYGETGHRHQPEIVELLHQFSALSANVTFSPHLLPVYRGILSTIYLNSEELGMSSDQVFSVLSTAYKNEPFVKVRSINDSASLHNVAGSNMCHITMLAKQNGQNNNTLVIVSVIDNLLKGAAGQGVQCMNVATGWDEHLGLPQ